MNEDRLKSSHTRVASSCIASSNIQRNQQSLLFIEATSRSDRLFQTTLKGIQSNAFIIIKSVKASQLDT
jgi:hypothetical protein